MTGKQFLRIVVLQTKIISISSLCIGTLYVLYSTGGLIIPNLVLMFCAALAVDMGTTAFNSYYDFVRKVDSKTHTKEKDKVLVHEGVKPGEALALSLALFGIGGFFGIALTILVGWQMLVFGAAGMLIGFLYNAGPLPISNTPAGELFAGGFLGEVLITATVFAQTGTISKQTLLIGLPSTLLIASILTVNNTCDMKGDRQAGRRTLSLLIGRPASVVVILLFGTAAYTLLILFTTGIFTLLPKEVLFSGIPAAAFGIIEYVRMLKRGFSHETKSSNIGGIVRIFAVFTAAMLIGLGIAYFR